MILKRIIRLIIVLCVIFTIVFLFIELFNNTDKETKLVPNRPAAKKNNVWYDYNNSDTVIVFVHGIFSDSRDAWFYKDNNDPSKNQYWPELIRTDEKFGKVAIFLGGYYTEITSGDYKFRDAANQLYNGLVISTSPAQEPLLSKPNIIFITHSAGGIVVRYMLNQHYSDFKDKKVGLVLIASPSIGAKGATRLDWLANLAKQKMGKQLQWNHGFLEELDKNFRILLEQRKISGLVGVEFIENHFIVKWLLFFNKKVLVEESSAARYFAEPKRIPNTDHFSIVKPKNRKHPTYRFFRQFYEQKFRQAPISNVEATVTVKENKDGSATLIFKFHDVPEKYNVDKIRLYMNQTKPIGSVFGSPSSQVKAVTSDIIIPANIFDNEEPVLDAEIRLYQKIAEEPYALAELTLCWPRRDKY
jgi:hypothetical protein